MALSYWGGLWPDLAAGSGGSSDIVSPVITIISTPEEDTDPFIVQVYDETGLTLYQLTCQDRSDGMRLVVYDGGFMHPFNGRSTITGAGTSGDPYVFTVYRRGRWPTGLDIDFLVRAVDTGGNTTEA